MAPASDAQLTPVLEAVVDHITIGIFIVNARMEIVQWNHFMEVNSGKNAESVLGRNLFDCFPDLPRNVLENKLKGVFLLKNFAFSSWQARPYLFKFAHNRPVTGADAATRIDRTRNGEPMLRLPYPDHSVGLKVGQSLDPITGKAVEGYQERSKAGEAPEAKAAEKGGKKPTPPDAGMPSAEPEATPR